MRAGGNGGEWTGWATSASGESLQVTSDRLDQDDVASKMFPKVRSWIALGAPLELLSPLSIARVVGLVALATWVIGTASMIYPVAVGAALVLVSSGAMAFLLKARALSAEHGPILVMVTRLSVLAGVVSTSNDHRVVMIVPIAATLSVYTGLFLSARRLLVSQLIALVMLPVATALTYGATAFGDSVTVVTFSFLLSAMIALTARNSRMAGLIDPDTGIMNSRGLENDLEERTTEHETIIATVRMRGVGEVRDALGPGAAIEMIRRAVEDLGQVLPTAVRFGRQGDDVVVLLENDPLLAQSVDSTTDMLVRKIDSAIGTGRYVVGAIEVTLSVHVGVAVVPSGPVEVGSGEFLRQSSLAARSAQDSGRSVSSWKGESTTLTAADLAILTDLRQAADRGELWIAFQPQVRIPDGQTVAAEALLRWESPIHGFVPPARFVPLAERTGLIDRLTDWVLAEALDAQARWRVAGFDITVSVNISPLSLRSVDFGDRVMRQLEDRDLPPGVLILEVTESVAFDIPEAVERLAPLREKGVRISIDDFGTGYTSLASLPHLPLDELKVDQQFVRNALTSPASEAITRSVCELGHRLGLSVVAEGVEDATLADLMTVFGFDLLQGYHFAKPMPEAQLLDRLAEQEDFSVLDPASPLGGAGGQPELAPPVPMESA